MNGSGITPFNSGPLLLRTYRDGSSNNTYVVQNYDLPVSTNYAMITSADGLLAPSDSIYLSSVTVSSLSGNTTTISSTYESYRTTISSIISTATLNSTTYGGITGSSLYTNIVVASSYTNVPSTSTTNLVYTNLSGGPGSKVTVDNLIGNFTLTAGTFAATTFGNITFVNMSGVGNEVSNVYSTNYLYTNGVYAGVCANPTIASVVDNLSTLSTTFLSTLNTIGSTLVANTIYVSTTFVSTVTAINANINALNRPPIVCTINLVNVTGTTIVCSTLNTSTTTYSTLIGSTTLADQINLTAGTFSTLTGSTMIVSSLAASTMYLSSFLGSTMTFSTFAGSTLLASTLTIANMSTNQFTTDVMVNASLIGGLGANSTFMGSTINVSTMIGSTMYLSYAGVSTMQASTTNALNMTYSTLQGSTLTSVWLYTSKPQSGISSLLGSTVTTSTLNASTVYLSSLNTSTIGVSTLWGSSVTGSTLTVSTANIGTFYGSTVSYSAITVSTINGSSLTATTLTYKTVTISSITLSSLLTSTFNAMNVSTMYSIDNTALGCSSLLQTTGINHTALGYGALSSVTTGSYDTAVGYGALGYTTMGSGLTAVGAGAGALTGHIGAFGTYLGYRAIPSQNAVTNEIILGGANLVGLANTGSGLSNTMVIGNPSISKTVLYASVGIGTLSPITTLDVRGSYQQIGGNQFIQGGSASSYVSYVLYNDSPNGASLFLNGASRAVDGGPSFATLRNDNGVLFLQAQSGNPSTGLTILSGGNVGINSASPVVALDVNGGLAITSTLQVGTVIINGILQGNGNNVSQTTQWSGTSPIYYTVGNVGIGTKVPMQTLDVYGNGYATGAMSVTTIATSSLKCGVLDTQNNPVYMSSMTTGAITCSTINAQGGLISCGNLITSTIGGKVIPTAFPPSGMTFNNNMGIGFGNWFMSGTYTTYDETANVPAAFSINYTPSGNGVSLSTFSFTWTSHSDRRIKQGIRGIGAVLQRFLQLRPVNYYLKADRARGRMSGFIAQEVRRIFPLLVSDSTINPDDAFETNLMGIQYTLFFPYLFKALQEQYAIVKAHTKQIAEWKAHIDQAKKRLQQTRERMKALSSSK